MERRRRRAGGRPLEPDDLRRIRQIGGFALSPRGSHLAYSMNRGGEFDLYLRRLPQGGERRLTALGQSALRPTFSPDGRRIVFQADLDGNESFDLYELPVRGGTPHNLTQNKTDEKSPAFSPDGRWLAFLSNQSHDMENLCVMPAGGGPIRQLTQSLDLPVDEFAWAPDSTTLAYSVGVGDCDRLGLVTVDGSRNEIVLSHPAAEYRLSGSYYQPRAVFSPDGQTLLFVSTEHDQADVGLLRLANRHTTWLLQSPFEKLHPTWSPDGGRVAFLENRNGEVQLRVLRLGQRRSRLLSPPVGDVSDFLWHLDGRRILYRYSRWDQPEELWIADGAPRRLTRVVRGKLPLQRLIRPRMIRYRSFDGREIPALLYRSKRAGRRAPGVVYVHGGPEDNERNCWNYEIQMLASRGYTVIDPNFRGSTGYGRGFRKLSDRDLGGGDLQDVVYAASYLFERDLAARDRIGIMGASYGGYLTLHALTQAPQVWAAGVSTVGFFDWVTEFSTERGYLKAYDSHKMGDPRANPEAFRPRSPRYHLDRLDAPLLLLSGANDVRCPASETRQVCAELQALGKRFEAHEYPDEGHSFRRLANQIDSEERTVAFFERYLGPPA